MNGRSDEQARASNGRFSGGWNSDVLKTHFDARLEDLSRSLDNRFEGVERETARAKDSMERRMLDAEKAVESARVSMEKRLDGMNEFRDTLQDQAARFITRTEHEQVQHDINDLKQSRAELAGKASQQSVNIAQAMAAASLLAFLLDIAVRFFM